MKDIKKLQNQYIFNKYFKTRVEMEAYIEWANKPTYMDKEDWKGKRSQKIESRSSWLNKLRALLP